MNNILIIEKGSVQGRLYCQDQCSCSLL